MGHIAHLCPVVFASNVELSTKLTNVTTIMTDSSDEPSDSPQNRFLWSQLLSTKWIYPWKWIQVPLYQLSARKCTTQHELMNFICHCNLQVLSNKIALVNCCLYVDVFQFLFYTGSAETAHFFSGEGRRAYPVRKRLAEKVKLNWRELHVHCHTGYPVAVSFG